MATIIIGITTTLAAAFLIAVLIAKISDLENRVKELENYKMLIIKSSKIFQENLDKYKKN